MSLKRKAIYKTISKSVEKRHRAEKRFQLYGIFAIAISFIFLAFLLFSIVSNGYTAFIQTNLVLPITLEQKLVEKKRYAKILSSSAYNYFSGVEKRTDRRQVKEFFISRAAKNQLEDFVANNQDKIGSTVDVPFIAPSNLDMLHKGKLKYDPAKGSSLISPQQYAWYQQLINDKRLDKSLNAWFLSSGASREPELAGVMGSLIGSILVVLACMFAAFPLGVMTAIYLEEFSPKNKITHFIEVNISNLAAVPSIVFGLLGLVIYLQVMGIPRSAPLAGGLTLALMALPIIVISTRAAIRAIPQTIRDGALALGASKLQTTLHHVLPLAMPGIMTGTILSVARVLGETAPLLMIGMFAFIVDIPTSFTGAATALPVQIYMWSDSAELGYAEKTSAAIMVLLLFLVLANALAVYLRKKFEIRW